MLVGHHVQCKEHSLGLSLTKNLPRGPRGPVPEGPCMGEAEGGSSTVDGQCALIMIQDDISLSQDVLIKSRVHLHRVHELWPHICCTMRGHSVVIPQPLYSAQTLLSSPLCTMSIIAPDTTASFRWGLLTDDSPCPAGPWPAQRTTL